MDSNNQSIQSPAAELENRFFKVFDWITVFSNLIMIYCIIRSVCVHYASWFFNQENQLQINLIGFAHWINVCIQIISQLLHLINTIIVE